VIDDNGVKWPVVWLPKKRLHIDLCLRYGTVRNNDAIILLQVPIGPPG